MIIKQIKYLFFFLLTILLGATPTHAKTEAVVFVPSYTQHFAIVQTAPKHSLQKTVQPNVGFLKEKFRFVVSESISAVNNCNFSEVKRECLVEGGGDLASFVSKSLSDKLKHIDDIWKTKYPIPDMLGGRSFFEDVMGQYRYTKSSGWLHTGDISFNFKGIDFYKGTESANQIFASTAVSMKTTISTNVNTWLASASMQKNVKFLKEGLDPSIGIVSNGKTMFITNAKIDIYMPKANITPTLKTQWMNKLNTVDPDITFEIKALEDFIN